MFLYEELDLNALLDDPEIDPDSPEALYAAAQCYRLGKGTPVNEAMYEEILRLAAKKGSEAAQKELKARESGAGQPANAEPEKPRALYEIFRLAEAEDPAALLEMARYCREHGRAKDECNYLLRAAELVSRGAYSAQQGQDLYIRLGELYATQPLENPGESNRCYGMACELGSTAAMLVLADQSARGYGCQKSAERARAWKLRAAERGTPEVKCAVALELGTEDRLRARALLDEVIHTAPDEALRARAQLSTDLLGTNGEWTPELIERAWPLREDPTIARVLTEHYLAVIGPQDDGTNTDTARVYRETTCDLGPEYLRIDSREDGTYAAGVLPVTPEWADWLWRRPMKDSYRRLWAAAARDLGSEEAREYLDSTISADAIFRKAMQCLYANDWRQAAELCKQAAEQGSGAAAWHCAYSILPDVPKYRQERDMWRRKAAEWDCIQELDHLASVEYDFHESWAKERLITLAKKGYSATKETGVWRWL